MATEPIKIGKGITARIMNVTPEHAKHLLKKNTRNRALSDSTVSRYAIDMKEGYWQWNGVPLLISTSEILLDGQQRLEAIIKSGVAIEILILWGLPDESWKSIDTGKSRTGKDVLSVCGMSAKKAGALSALIQKEFNYERGSSSTVFSSNRNGAGSGHYKARMKINNQIVIERYEANKSFYDEIFDLFFTEKLETKFTLHYYANKIKVAGDMFMLYSMLYKVNIAEARKFITGVVTGFNLSPTSPAYYLRSQLIKLANDDKYTLPPKQKLILYFKCWNYYRIGKEIKSLRLIKNEKIPKLI